MDLLWLAFPRALLHDPYTARAVDFVLNVCILSGSNSLADKQRLRVVTVATLYRAVFVLFIQRHRVAQADIPATFLLLLFWLLLGTIRRR